MRYTIPQLEGLAEALAEINKDPKDGNDDDDKPLTGQDAIDSLKAHGFIK